ncbi:MAG: mechanosensitive ion channel [Xanthomonadaceae bacterium]|nr:mechanosensitive ion channel [Xanthomonadaceae bacterium]
METINEAFATIDTAMLLAWTWQLFAAALIFVIGRWIARMITGSLKRMMSSRGLDIMLVTFLGAILYSVLLIAVVIAALSQLGIQTTPLIAVLGAAGLAIGLALQNSLGNFAAGVMLVLFRPFTKGNFIDAGGTMGTVKEVGIFSTILDTPDNRRIIVPNAQITGGTITNFSAYDTRRIDMIIGVDYSDDLRVARKAIEKVIAEHEKILKEPEPAILLMDLADSSVNFAVRPWVNSDDYWVVRGELMEQIKGALEASGCSIPFPQRDVHVVSSPDNEKQAA